MTFRFVLKLSIFEQKKDALTSNYIKTYSAQGSSNKCKNYLLCAHGTVTFLTLFNASHCNSFL